MKKIIITMMFAVLLLLGCSVGAMGANSGGGWVTPTPTKVPTPPPNLELPSPTPGIDPPSSEGALALEVRDMVLGKNFTVTNLQLNVAVGYINPNSQDTVRITAQGIKVLGSDVEYVFCKLNGFSPLNYKQSDTVAVWGIPMSVHGGETVTMNLQCRIEGVPQQAFLYIEGETQSGTRLTVSTSVDLT